jgi:hypothetical protein
MRNVFVGVLIAAVLEAAGLTAVAIVPLRVEMGPIVIDGGATCDRAPCPAPEAPADGTETHVFDPAGRLIEVRSDGGRTEYAYDSDTSPRRRSTDCVANEHEIDPGQIQKSVDMRTGTTRTNHRHVQEAGSLGWLRPPKTATFHYNERGEIEKVTEK